MILQVEVGRHWLLQLRGGDVRTMAVHSDVESVFSLPHILHTTSTTTDQVYHVFCFTCEVRFHFVSSSRGVAREGVSTVDQLASLTSFAVAWNVA